MIRRRARPGARFVAAIALAVVLAVAAGCGSSHAHAPSASPAASAPAATATGTPARGGVALRAGTPTPAVPSATPAAPAAVATPAAGGGMAPATSPAPSEFEALPGAAAFAGRLGDTLYRIEIPLRWNGGLVLWAHGFSGFSTQLSVSNPPDALRHAFIDEGYAWAASSYRSNGWVPGAGAADTLALKRYFVQRFGTPGRTYIAGESMGGAVVALSLERYPAAYDGALSVCGALGNETEIDYLLSWWEAASYFAGVQLPIGDGAVKVADVLTTRLLPALGAPGGSDAARAFESVIRNLTGGPRPFFDQGFREQYLPNFGLLLFDPDRTTLAGRAATNANVDYAVAAGLGYTSAEVNAGIRRLAADPALRDVATHPELAPTTGRISVPLLTLHDTGDLYVPISEEVAYARAVAAAGRSDLLVQRAIRAPGHCQFSPAELTSAWNALVNWVANGVHPAGDTLGADLRNVGRRFTDPLRAGDPGGE